MIMRGLAGLITGLFALCTSAAERASATPALVIELESGAVLYEDHATQPWYPASLTKLMTVYVALNAVRDHKIALDTPLTVSARAASMPPSKMQFPPGTLVTLDNALKMLMVKSANDIAVVIAEGVAGSVEAFAEDMNDAARSLGLTQSHFVNPNGLPDPQHISSARDMAILARALYLTFPEHANLFGIGALRFGGAIIQNHNNMLGRYPGVDGMKTGFTCAAGFNLVASATQGNRKLIAVVLGAPNVQQRTIMTAALFDRGFAGIDRPSGSLMNLSAASQSGPPDLHQSVCRKRGKAVAEFNTDLQRVMAPLLSPNAQAGAKPGHFVLTTMDALSRPAPMAPRIALVPRPSFNPVPVFVGAPASYGGLVAQARPPHSPLGTPPLPGTVSAFAPVTATQTEEAGAPLSPDTRALPMKARAKPAKPVSAPTHGGHRHHVARAERDLEESEAPAKGKKATKAHTKAAADKAALKKPPAKAAAAEKKAPKSQSGSAAKAVGKAQPAAKAAPHSEKSAHEKAKAKKPEKHAKE
ncbi:D-alanyl-D-alanine carboxypeptidase [Beijerinckiaceae bacterium]|nr:D-alanyl-D-alanine carboxypeptidase [Beijerinckiaceae bacterium]